MKPKIPAARVRELLDYNSETGVFVWRVSNSNRRSAGSIAGSRHPKTGWLIGVDGTQYKAHRLAWLHYYGKWPPGSLDHKDGNNLNNAIANLRVATFAQNSANMRTRPNNKIGLKGVSRANQKWFAGSWLITSPSILECLTHRKRHMPPMQLLPSASSESSRALHNFL